VRILSLRHELLKEIRAFFDGSGYLEVETPCLVPSTVPESHIDLFRTQGGLLLAASPEPQMKRLLAEGHERIYQVTRAFRQGEEGRWHNPEFTILEWYRSGADHRDLMEETQELVLRLYRRAGRTEPGFTRMSVDEAFGRWAEWRPSSAWDEERFYRDLVERVEPRLGDMGAVFLTDYPAGAASLARLSRPDPSVCERFELYIDGIEIANAFSELTDPAEQRSRLEQANTRRARAGRPEYPIDERFLEALEAGLPHSAGIAVGLDRLVAVVAGIGGVDGAMAFSWKKL
jgi:lysyl-tRNA synthetase class 2